MRPRIPKKIGIIPVKARPDFTESVANQFIDLLRLRVVRPSTFTEAKET